MNPSLLMERAMAALRPSAGQRLPGLLALHRTTIGQAVCLVTQSADLHGMRRATGFVPQHFDGQGFKLANFGLAQVAQQWRVKTKMLRTNDPPLLDCDTRITTAVI